MLKLSRVIFAAAFAVGMSFVSFGEIINPVAFDYTIEYKVSGYSGTTTVTDLPILVRLKNDVPSGFDYADCPQDSIRFADGEGNLIPHEVDTWNASGESLIWVKVPSVAGQETAFAMYYGSERVKPVALAPSEVWTNYRGVWHLNESGDDGGTTDPVVVVNATSSGADLNGEAYGGTVGVAGKIGGGRRISDSTDTKNALGGIWVDGSKDCADVGSKLTISGWMIHRNQAYYYDHVFYRREASNSSKGGIAIEINNTANGVAVRGNGNTSATIGIPSAVKTDWTYLSFVYNEKTATVYANGEKAGSGSIGAATDNDLRWVFGNDTDGYKGAAGDISWKGSMDEIRLSAAAQTDDYAKAEYQAMGEDFLTAGEVVPLDSTAPAFETPVVQVASDGSATMTFTVTDGEGEVSTLVDGVKTYVGAIGTDITLNEPKTVAITIAEDACIEVGVYGINAKGTEVTRYAESGVMNAAVEAVVTNDANERGLIPGVFTISRPYDVATDLPIIVNLSWEGGSAVQGKNYSGDLPASVTIPAGATSTTVVVTPLRDAESDNDETIVLTVAAGAYKSGATATMKILNLVTDPNYNTWFATADGKASDATNWSQGVPQAGQKILFDSQFSTASCEWDGGVNGLATTVAEWKQLEGYTGTITFDTTYTGAFNSLSVTGDVTLGGGMWTHLANTAAEEYRLKVVVGGNVAIAAAAKIDASGKGFASGKARPGSAKGCHASPMGSAAADKLYGDVKKPEALGSGNDKGAGGGAIYIEATGSFTNDGELNVNSLGGAAGSIYVKAASVAGAGTYSAQAPVSVSGKEYQAGSGGRIAFELTDSASITDDEDAFVSGKCATGFAFNSRNSAAGGTVLIKSTSHANGVLYVNGQTAGSYSYTRLQPEFKNMLAIPVSEIWALDGIVFLNKPMAALKVPEGATLSLPNGLASVKAYGNDAGIGGKGGNLPVGNRGLVIDGGTLSLPPVVEHLIANRWTFQAARPYTLSGDVRVNANGRIGVVAGYATTYAYTNRCDLIVTGDLMVESGGSIDATGAGWKNYSDAVPTSLGWSVNSVSGAHGGVSSQHSIAIKYVYDSILNPMLPGEGSQNGDSGNAVFGGGCVKLTIGGALMLAGKAQAKSVYQDVNGGAGGTINITCGSITGSGTIDATTQSAYGGTQGGGGRVAIRLTGVDSDFTSYPLSRITVTQSGSQSSGGTIYLQTATESENCGTVYIKGDAGNTAKQLTPFPSPAGGGENDDFSRAKLKIVNNGKVILSTDVKVRELEIGNAGVMDFNGKVLTTGIATLIKSDGSTSAKLTSGTYTAAQLNELTGTTVYTDSVGGGSLVVQSGSNSGLVIFFR